MSFFKKTWLSNFVLVSLIIAIIAPLFYFPKKAEAQWPVFDIPTEVNTAITAAAGVTETTKDVGLDSVAWFIAKIIIRKITAQTVNWINSGFNGNPAYITDPNQFFLNVGDQMAGRVLSATSLNKLCSPFQAKVRIALVKNYLAETDPSYYSNTCTLGKLEQNFENFTNDFSYGGWDSFFQVTQNSQNNPYGAYLDTKNQLSTSIGTQANKYQKQLEWGKGVLSYERCKPGTEQQAGARVSGSGTLNQGPSLECKKPHLPTSPTDTKTCDEYYDVRETNVDTGLAVGDCTPDNKETVTPGTVIEGQMQNVFGSNIKQLEMADEINEIVSALLGQLTNALIGGIGKGLRGLTQKDSTTARTYLEQISQGSTETTAEDLQASTTITNTVNSFEQNVQQAGDTVSQNPNSGVPLLVLNSDSSGNSSPMFVQMGTIFTDPGAEAVDPITKSRTTVISPDTVDTNTKGDYILNYSFTGSDGQTATIQRTVTVQ